MFTVAREFQNERDEIVTIRVAHEEDKVTITKVLSFTDDPAVEMVLTPVENDMLVNLVNIADENAGTLHTD
jgi:hypothetical protein